jgi:lipopolysaccharide transport system permease protein
MLLFATPIFYPIDSMPHFVRVASEFNPFYILVDGYRQPLVHHQSPKVISLLYLAVLSTVLFYLGLRAFRRVKGHFEAVL